MSKNPTPTIVVPARLASSRFPKKLLADAGGMPLILRTANRLRNQVPENDLVYLRAVDVAILTTKIITPTTANIVTADLIGLLHALLVLHCPDSAVATAIVKAIAPKTIAKLANATIDIANDQILKLLLAARASPLLLTRAVIANCYYYCYCDC